MLRLRIPTARTAYLHRCCQLWSPSRLNRTSSFSPSKSLHVSSSQLQQNSQHDYDGVYHEAESEAAASEEQDNSNGDEHGAATQEQPQQRQPRYPPPVERYYDPSPAAVPSLMPYMANLRTQYTPFKGLGRLRQSSPTLYPQANNPGAPAASPTQVLPPLPQSIGSPPQPMQQQLQTWAGPQAPPANMRPPTPPPPSYPPGNGYPQVPYAQQLGPYQQTAYTPPNIYQSNAYPQYQNAYYQSAFSQQPPAMYQQGPYPPPPQQNVYQPNPNFPQEQQPNMYQPYPGQPNMYQQAPYYPQQQQAPWQEQPEAATGSQEHDPQQGAATVVEDDDGDSYLSLLDSGSSLRRSQPEVSGARETSMPGHGSEEAEASYSAVASEAPQSRVEPQQAVEATELPSDDYKQTTGLAYDRSSTDPSGHPEILNYYSEAQQPVDSVVTPQDAESQPTPSEIPTTEPVVGESVGEKSAEVFASSALDEAQRDEEVVTQQDENSTQTAQSPLESPGQPEPMQDDIAGPWRPTPAVADTASAVNLPLGWSTTTAKEAVASPEAHESQTAQDATPPIEAAIMEEPTSAGEHSFEEVHPTQDPQVAEPAEPAEPADEDDASSMLDALYPEEPVESTAESAAEDLAEATLSQMFPDEDAQTTQYDIQNRQAPPADLSSSEEQIMQEFESTKESDDISAMLDHSFPDAEPNASETIKSQSEYEGNENDDISAMLDHSYPEETHEVAQKSSNQYSTDQNNASSMQGATEPIFNHENFISEGEDHIMPRTFNSRESSNTTQSFMGSPFSSATSPPPSFPHSNTTATPWQSASAWQSSGTHPNWPTAQPFIPPTPASPPPQHTPPDAPSAEQTKSTSTSSEITTAPAAPPQSTPPESTATPDASTSQQSIPPTSQIQKNASAPTPPTPEPSKPQWVSFYAAKPEPEPIAEQPQDTHITQQYTIPPPPLAQSMHVPQALKKDPTSRTSYSNPTYAAAARKLLSETNKAAPDLAKVFGQAKDIARQGFAPTVETYSVLTGSLAKQKDRVVFQHLAIGLLEEMKSEGLQPNSTIYHNILKILAVSPDFITRERVLEEMRMRWIPLTQEGVECVIFGLLTDGQLERALDIFDSRRINQDPISIAVYLEIIKSLGRAFEVDEALRIGREAIEELPQEKTAMIWYELLNVTASSLHLEGTLWIWRSAVEKNIFNPDDGVCLRVLNTAARNGAPQLAGEVLRVLSDRGVKIEEAHYNSLITAFARGNNLPMAFRTVQKIREAGIVPSSTTSSAIADAIIADGKIENVDATYFALKDRHSEASATDPNAVDIIAFNAVIEACVRLNDMERALGVYNDSASLGVDPTTETYNLLFYGCLGDWYERMSPLEPELLSSSENRPPPPQKELAMFLAGEMKATGKRPDMRTYEALLQTSLYQEDYEDAFMYLEEMKGMRDTIGPVRPLVYQWIGWKLFAEEDERIGLLLEEMNELDYVAEAQMVGRMLQDRANFRAAQAAREQSPQRAKEGQAAQAAPGHHQEQPRQYAQEQPPQKAPAQNLQQVFQPPPSSNQIPRPPNFEVPPSAPQQHAIPQ